MFLSRRFRLFIQLLRDPRLLRRLYQGVAFAPRLIVHLASVAALAGLATSCVPATRYEEAKSAGDVELAARQHAEQELVVTRGKLQAALDELQARDQKLAASEDSISQSKLDNTMAIKERDEATGLVDQLRGELARVGDDLRSFAQQKADLEKTLAAAEARKQELERMEARTAALALLTRDLTSALGDRVTSGDVGIDVRAGHLVLSAPSELLFKDDGALRPESDGVLAALARVLTLHSEQTLIMWAPTEAHIAALTTALAGRAIVATRLKPAASGDAKSVVLSFDAS